LKPYSADLRYLEQSIEYPLDNGEQFFTIDHGNDYTRFFNQQGDRSLFILILDGSKVIGSLAGVWKSVQFWRRPQTALYLADLKMAHFYRGKGIMKRLLWSLFWKWLFRKDFKGWDFLYFCAMQREGKGVDHSFKGLHIGSITRPVAELLVFMIKPELILNWKPLNSISLENSINLSPRHTKSVQWNEGAKTILNTVTGEPIRLGHMDPALWYGDRAILHESAEGVMAQRDALACFAVDTRQTELLHSLQKGGITTSTVCKIFSFAPFAKSLRSFDTLLLSTGEI